MKRMLSTVLTGLAVMTLAATARAQVDVVDYFPNLPAFNSPVDIQNAGDGSGRLFVVEQPGFIRVFPVDTLASSTSLFLDISSVVDNSGGEEGLLGLAFHPEYPDSPYIYVNYTTNVGSTHTQVSRFTVSSNPDSIDPASELSIIQIPKPFENHNSGRVTFGPDGYLYIGTGDGGGAGDPNGNGQNLATLNGAILRIDVDNPAGGGQNYGIPPDNPWAGNGAGFREEIWAYGLRNPWRFSFDSQTGDLWLGDVGQNLWEEVDLIAGGGNYGWNVVEGNHCYPSDPCNSSGMTPPIWEYFHDSGRRSIAGGYVYRGSTLPTWVGQYFYADTYSGEIWALDWNGSTATNQPIADTAFFISTFGVDENGELYFADLSAGRIHRLGSQSGTPVLVTAFGAMPVGDKVELSWVISTDEPVAGFEIMRKTGIGTARKIHSGTLPPDLRAFEDADVEPGGTYTYQLFVVIDGNRSLSSQAIRVEVPRARIELEQNHPNPFNPGTAIAYTIGNGAWVDMTVYDVGGRRIRTLVSASLPAGPHEARWDGRDSEGNPQASGVYYYVMKVDGRTVATRRMVLLK